MTDQSLHEPHHERYRDALLTLGPELFAKVQGTKVLVVGAGGIGCELIKNLVLLGFHDIETIDLDTIDVSNLNRQFLFQKQHIGQSKAQVARQSALNFNPHVRIVAHHANIKTNEYGPEYFKQFSLVMNALDNLDARRHVNRMCLAADVPLIESGTEGYLGQVTVIKKDKTECFDCTPRPTPKTFAVCTIRSSPSKPIHCIVWAKRLFSQIFGEAGEEDTVTDLNEDELFKDSEERKSEESDLATLRQARTQLREHLATVQKACGPPNWLFEKVFYADLELLSLVGQIKAKRQSQSQTSNSTLPQPIRYDDTLASTEEASGESNVLLKEQRVWTLRENAHFFISSATKLYKRKAASGSISFDKDDVDAMDFVTSASNLRSHAFGIPKQSRFNVKAMAGNIIPAIATTNAIIAGLIVLEALKVIDGRVEDCRSSYLLRRPSNKRFLLPAQLEEPNSNCYVCGSSFVQVAIDTEKTTLKHFIDQLLCSYFGMLEPSIMIGFDLIYESGDDAMDFHHQLSKTLQQLRITHNTVVKVEDACQDLELEVSIIHKCARLCPKVQKTTLHCSTAHTIVLRTAFEEGLTFEVKGNASAKSHHAATDTKKEAPPQPQAQESEDDLIVLSSPTSANTLPSKRKREEETHDEKEETRSSKRRREENDNMIILD